MPRLTNKLPSLRHHKASGRAVVTLNGRDHYVGAWNSPESRVEYDRLVAEWLASGRGQAKVAEYASTAQTKPTVEEVILAYWKFAETHYRGPDRTPTQELANMKDALKPVRKLYGHTLAQSFGPLALRAVRDAMVKSGLARSTTNARINRIRRVFRWAVSVELIPAAVDQALQTVQGLQKGRTEAHETDPIHPVPMEDVEATLPHLPRPVAAMVRLQLLTGCRLGEIVVMRGCDLFPGEPTWEYRPARHKNEWRGQARAIPLGPRAQEIVKAFLKPDTMAYLFAPADAVEEMRNRRRETRKTRRTPSELNRLARTAKRRARRGETIAPQYDRRTYRQAVVRGCDRAFPHPTLSAVKPEDLTPEQCAELKRWRDDHRWSPLQLRHAAGTAIRAPLRAGVGAGRPGPQQGRHDADLCRA
jgi:integrase